MVDRVHPFLFGNDGRRRGWLVLGSTIEQISDRLESEKSVEATERAERAVVICDGLPKT